MADETHCHADGAGPCLAGDCPIAGQGPLAGHLRPCPGAPGPQHAVATKDFPRAHLDRWVSGPPAGAPSLPDFLLARYAEDEEAALVEPEDWGFVGDPSKSRSFADIEAKRRIVEMEWHHLGDDDYAWGMEEAKRQILAVLALPYADHPDYREEWKT